MNVSVAVKKNKTTGPYRSSEKLNDAVSKEQKLVTKSKGPLEELTASSSSKPVMLHDGKEWFDRNAVVQHYKSTIDSNFELFQTYKKTWVEKIGNKYFKTNEERAMLWLLEHCPHEFEKCGGFEKAKEV